jgi:hypothetical protein
MMHQNMQSVFLSNITILLFIVDQNIILPALDIVISIALSLTSRQNTI